MKKFEIVTRTPASSQQLPFLVFCNKAYIDAFKTLSEAEKFVASHGVVNRATASNDDYT